MIDRKNLKKLRAIEEQRFIDLHPKSGELFKQAASVMPGGVPMSWMLKWPGSYPLFLASAESARMIDIDGNELIDFCLGDTGSMAGHSPAPVVQAIKGQLDRGLSVMLPTEDSIYVSRELARRFNLPLWQFTVSATDANRHAIRYSRLVTGKKKIIVIDRCYHGSVDESFAALDGDGKVVAREGNIGAPVPLDMTTRVVEFNNLDAMQAALKCGDVAAILMEPAMTNVGIVLPEAGYLEAVGDLAKRYGALWILDETHTISMGPGGMVKALGLRPDMVTLGKSIGGGVAVGTFGMTEELSARIAVKIYREVIDTGGVGGTMAGSALAMAAMRATLSEVLTDQAFKQMIALGDRWCDGVDLVIEEFQLPWHCSRLGARGEYLFQENAPKTGGEAARAGDFELEQYIHLRLLNDGILLTPFHNMALISPDTTAEDVDAHTQCFRKMCSDLVS